MYWALDEDSPHNEGELHGILQVHVWGHTGHLVLAEGYGMRLDHVGVGVREHLAALGGSLRDTPVNKVVKVYFPKHDDPTWDVNPQPAYGFLIAADNQIRGSYNPGKDDVGIAEIVQSMSLSNVTV